MLLLGVPQLNDLDIQVDTHRKTRDLPLVSYDPTIDFDADIRLQCHLSEKDLLAWSEFHHDTPLEVAPYTYLDVLYFDGLAPDELAQLRAASKQYKKVFDATKGGLPALANHPPVSLNFKEGWKHVSVPVPKWGPGAIAVLSRWAKEMLDSGLYIQSKSPSASRPHIVRKTPPNAPKDVNITQCSMRVCGDYRMANDQLQKSFPTTANGTDELAKLPGYTYYWYTDRFSMYNAYALEPGPSRELLAIHTPLGLIEPTRMVFGEMNAGTVACAATPAILRTLPNKAHLRTASYVDDHAQGSNTFAELLHGYTDFLALCERENWTLNATKTMVGFPSCPFFGFVVDKTGTRLADKNLDPVRRMVPPSNVPELRKTLGVFVQSSRFIPNYAHVVRPLTALTRSANGKPVAFTWTKEQQDSFDHIRNLLLDGIHLAPPDYRLPFHSGGDASNDGKAYGIFQYNDLSRDTQFTVESHHATHTIVRLTTTNTLHTIPHTIDTRHNIAWFSKVWSEADRKRAPFYLEADTLLWGLAKCRFWALSSPFPLYAFSDHLPLKWVRKCEKDPSVNLRSNSSLTYLGFIPIYPALKIPSLMPSAATHYSVLVSSHPSVYPTLSPLSWITSPSPSSPLASFASSPRHTRKRWHNKYKHGAFPRIPSTFTPSPTSIPLPPTRISFWLCLAPRTLPASPPAFSRLSSRSPSCYLPTWRPALLTPANSPINPI
jgi:hypothetical protein